MCYMWVRSALFSLVITFHAVLAAQWSSDPNEGTRIDDGINVAMEILGLPDQHGGAVFSWNNYSGYSPVATTSLQRITVDGTLAWHSQDANSTQYNQSLFKRPAVVDADGNIYVMFQTYPDLNITQVRVQKFNPDGQAQWPGLGKRVCTFEGDFHREEVGVMLLNDDGTLIVCWTDNRDTGGSTIYTQKFDPNGDYLWDVAGVRVSSVDIFYQGLSDATSDGAGGVIVTWVDSRFASAQTDVFAQRLSATGQRLWGDDDVIVCDAPNYQRGPQVESDGNGGFVAIWQDSRATRTEYYINRFNSDGAPLWAPNGSPFSTANYGSLTANLMVQDGHAWVMASMITGFPTDNIRVQKFDLATGTRQLGDTGVGVVPDYSGNNPVFATDNENGVIVAWSDKRTTAPGSTIYAQRVNPAGQPMWQTNGMPISTYPSPKQQIALVPIGGANTIVGWVDERNDTSGYGGAYGNHINPYAAYLLPDGTLLGTSAAYNWQRWE